MIVIGCSGRQNSSVERFTTYHYWRRPNIYLSTPTPRLSRSGQEIAPDRRGCQEQSGDMKRSIEQAIRAADAIEISSKAATIASQAAAESVIAVRSFPWTILYTTQKPSRNGINASPGIEPQRERRFPRLKTTGVSTQAPWVMFSVGATQDHALR